MKRLIALLTVLALSILMAVNVFAAGELVVDNADILTDSEEADLIARLTEMQAKYGMDFVAVTTPSTDGKTWREYADDYYDNNGYLPDGILLLISMDSSNRGYILSTAGKGIQYFTDYGLNEIEDDLYDYLVNGDYAGAVNKYAEDADWMAAQAANGEPYDTPYAGPEPVGPDYEAPFNWPRAIIFSIIFGAVIALIIVLIMKGRHRTIMAKNEATSYMIPGSLNITNSRDTFLYRNVTTVPIPQNNNRGGSGGGSSFHVSSGGISHGGSGGRGF